VSDRERGRGGLLLVEDNEADVPFFKRALVKVNADVPLEVAMNGTAAVHALSGVPLPSLLLLDLKLPRLSGHEVLEWMRSRPALKGLRTIVLTSSSEESDIRRAYALGAAAYVVKPVDVAGLGAVVAAVVECWRDPEGPALERLKGLAVPPPPPAGVVDNVRYR
jgi:CheY-like chemotaxis protein